MAFGRTPEVSFEDFLRDNHASLFFIERLPESARASGPCARIQWKHPGIPTRGTELCDCTLPFIGLGGFSIALVVCATSALPHSQSQSPSTCAARTISAARSRRRAVHHDLQQRGHGRAGSLLQASYGLPESISPRLPVRLVKFRGLSSRRLAPWFAETRPNRRSFRVIFATG